MKIARATGTLGRPNLRNWLILALAVVLCSAGLRAQSAEDIKPPTAPVHYRGVLMANVNSANIYFDEIIADFGISGVWVLDETWQQISGADAHWIMSCAFGSSAGKEIVADFGSLGLWVWEYSGYPGTWTQISGLDSESAFGTDDDFDGRQEIHVDFGSMGLWRYDWDGNSWYQLSGLNETYGLRMDTLTAGHEEGCHIFPVYGVWRIWWESGAPAFLQLTGTVTSETDHASAQFISVESEDLVIDFAALGLWICQHDDHSWHQISADTPNRLKEIRFVGGPDYELIVDWAGDVGTYWWNFNEAYPGTLTKISDWEADADGFCEPMDIDGDTEASGDNEAAIDFGANGLWLYDYDFGMGAQLSALNPQFMVAGDYWSVGYKDTLVVDFGASGLWRYRAKTQTWDQISGLSPDNN